MEAGLTDTLTIDELIDIAIGDRTAYDDREDMGGTALAEYYEALPAYTFTKLVNKMGSYEAFPSYSFGISQKVLKRWGSQDTFVRDKVPDQGYPYHYTVQVDNRTDLDDGYYSGLVGFDPFPSGGTVASAYMFIYRVEAFPPVWTYLRRCLSFWHEASATWNNRPSLSGVIQTVVIPGAVGWASIDITSTVQGWVDGSIGQYGVYFDSELMSAPDWILEFYSKDGSYHDLQPYILATINY